MKELKITGGTLNSRKITFCESEFLRPTLSKTREAVFNVLANYIEFKDTAFLDAFAGSGIMSFEAASRGFLEVYSIDSDKKNIESIKYNSRTLSVNLTPILGKMPLILENHAFFNKKFDVIYIDPPYSSMLYLPTLEILINKGLLANNGIIVTESLTKLNTTINGLKTLKQKVYSGKILTFLQKN